MAPSRKRCVLTVLAGGLLSCSAAFLAALLWGPLQPFSPWVVGFQHRDTDRARVYFHQGTDIGLLDAIDALVTGVEKTHGMIFPKKAEILVCGSDAEYRRLARTGARFCVFPKYGRLYVSARAVRDAGTGTIHLDTYLTHELSHSLLYQNMPLSRFIGFPDWLLEGLAVLNANQRGVDGYLSRDQVRAKMREGYFLHPSDFIPNKSWRRAEALRSFALPDKYWFLYSELACFVEDLVQSKGQAKFAAFERGLMDGKDEKTLFQAIYGQSFDDCVAAFRGRMTGSGP